MDARRIVIGSDHGGLELKRQLCESLAERGWEVDDVGCSSTSSVDYPDFAVVVASRIARGEAPFGVLICGTGIGMCVAANRHRGVRAALCHEGYSARMARAHNDANVLCMGGRVVGSDLAREVLATFLEVSFEGGRHQRRLEKIDRGEIPG